jgi:hypothetical protein
MTTINCPSCAPPSETLESCNLLLHSNLPGLCTNPTAVIQFFIGWKNTARQSPTVRLQFSCVQKPRLVYNRSINLQKKTMKIGFPV